MLLLGVEFFFIKKSGILLEYVSNSLDQDQAHHSARPDLDANCLQNQQIAKVITLARKELAKKVCLKKKRKFKL